MVLRPALQRMMARVGAAALVAALAGGWHLPDRSALATSAAAAQRQVVEPAPGVYRYTVHGSECAGVAFFQYCRSFPAQTRMVLTRAAGTITIELDYSGDHLETSRFAVHPDGRYLTWQRTKLVFGIAQDDSAPTVPPTLALPSTLKVGMRWTQHFNTGGLPVRTTNQVVRQAKLEVGGVTVSAFEIDADSITGGAHPGTENDVTWHDPASGLDVRLVIHRRITGVFPYKMDVDATLVSLQPAG